MDIIGLNLSVSPKLLASTTNHHQDFTFKGWGDLKDVVQKIGSLQKNARKNQKQRLGTHLDSCDKLIQVGGNEHHTHVNRNKTSHRRKTCFYD